MAGILALLAHPDDEFFCGGLLAALSERRVPVHLAYWTRGEGGGSARAQWAARMLPEPLRPRVRAAKKVAKLLRAESLTFLDAIDPAPNPALAAPDQSGESFLEKLQALVDAQKPELVVTHGSQGDYGHPAHMRLHDLAKEWAEGKLPVISFNAAHEKGELFLNAADKADFVFDAEAFLQLKGDMVRAHGSQGAALTSAAGGNLAELLRRTRYEGYRLWSEPEADRSVIHRWALPVQWLPPT